MPIRIVVDRARNRLVATYTGRITDEELLSAWRRYYGSEDWVPGLPELNDLSEADLRGVSADAIRGLAEFAAGFLQGRQVGSLKVAIYAPSPLPFGLARIYEALAASSPESVRVCRNLEDAEAWIGATPGE